MKIFIDSVEHGGLSSTGHYYMHTPSWTFVCEKFFAAFYDVAVLNNFSQIQKPLC